MCVFYVEVMCNLEGALHGDLMRGYNKNIRPMERNGEITEVKLKMTLTNLISLVKPNSVHSVGVGVGVLVGENYWHHY